MRRRTFLGTLGTIAGVPWVVKSLGQARVPTPSPLSRFKLGAISDEWSQDLEEALKAMKGYGLRWVEIRSVWGTYNTEASPEQLRRVKDWLRQYEFSVSVVDTALYKCVLPGTTSVSSQKDLYHYSGQMDLLKRAIERAQALGTDKVRVFAFWRTAQPETHFPRIAEELEKAAELARTNGIRLLLEDEGACNVSTGKELAQMLELVRDANFGANWDVGNPYWHGEVSYPAGYAALPKKRMWHMHLKDVRCEPGSNKCRTAIVGEGQVNLEGQLSALLADGYEGTMSLEPEYQTPSITHFEATRRSLEGLLKIMTRVVERAKT